jgi:hypothetical protein
MTNGFETCDRAGALSSRFEEDQAVQDREEESIARLERQHFGANRAASQSYSRRLRSLDPLLKSFRRVSPKLFSPRVMVSGGGAALLEAGDTLKMISATLCNQGPPQPTGQRWTSSLKALALLGAIALGGCGVAPAPIAHTPNVVATPQAGELVISVQAAKSVGEVVPVYVSVANGTDSARELVPSQVFAVNEVGERVAAIPPEEAARQAGNAKELQGAMQSGAISGVGGAALGAAAGAIAGAGGNSGGGWGFSSPSSGALFGTGFGGAWGVFSGAQAGQNKADQQANQQIAALSLKPEDVRRDFVVSGYVFFPKGSYQEVDLVLVDHESGVTETVRQPWH